MAAGVLAAMLAGSPGPAGEAGRAGRGEAAPRQLLAAHVLEVTDGDTIVVRLAGGAVERVRYIGVDTPESVAGAPVECHGHAAAAANARLLGSGRVLLRVGREPRDDYGRLLAYVFARAAEGGRGTLLSAALVAGGHARTLTIAPNDERAAMLERLQARAGREGRGLWSACPG